VTVNAFIILQNISISNKAVLLNWNKLHFKIYKNVNYLF